MIRKTLVVKIELSSFAHSSLVNVAKFSNMKLHYTAREQGKMCPEEMTNSRVY